jgi:methylaspartate ammonia-lyase
LIGLELGCFGAAVQALSAEPDRNDTLSNSAKYGLSQALLAATAAARRSSMAEVISAEYDFPLIPRRVPILCQSGEDRQISVDKMILRRADALPHGLINSPDLIGAEGAGLGDYVVWVRDRVLRHGPSNYRPCLHFDVYGGIGHAFDLDIERVVSFLCRLEALARPFALRIESPADFGSRETQIRGLAEIRYCLRERGSTVQVIADEWCNTFADVEAFVAGAAADLIQLKMPDMGSLDDIIRGVQVCQAGRIGVYLGGSCTETDVSARVSVHVAVATQVDMMLAKPGMGVDEGYTIVANEQSRLLAMLRARNVMGRDAEGAGAISAPGRA